MKKQARKGKGRAARSSVGKASARSWSPRQKMLARVVMVAVVLLAVLRVAWPGRESGLPSFDLSGVDPAVAQMIAEKEKKTRKTPNSSDAWGELGLVLDLYEFDEAAEAALERALHLDADRALWHFHLGWLLIEDGRTERGINHVERAAELDPATAHHTRLLLIERFIHQGEWDRASEQLDKANPPESDHALFALARGQLELARQNFEDAERHLSGALGDSRTRKRAASLLSMILLRSGREPEAAAMDRASGAWLEDYTWRHPFEREKQKHQTGLRSLVERCQRLLQERRIEEARPLIDTLQAEYPGSSEGYLFLGRLRVLEGNYEEAARAFERHLEMEPGSVDGWIQLGLAQMRQNKDDWAAASFAQAIELKPDADAATYNLAVAEWRLGRTNEAIQWFERTVRAQPGFFEAHLRLADVLARAGHSGPAAAALSNAMHLAPDDRRVREISRRLGLAAE